jgi:flagellar biosynthetic protein FliR
LDTVLAMLQASTALAMQLAAPVLLTVLVVDLVLGCLSKTMPQLNIMTAGLSLRSLVGMLILVLGIGVTTGVLKDELEQSIGFFARQWETAAGTMLGR